MTFFGCLNEMKALNLLMTTSALLVSMAWCENEEKLLLQDIFKNYNKEIRPVRNQSESVQVNLTMAMRKLKEINTKHEHITIVGWISASWKDISLAWNASEHGNIDYIAADASKVWLPTFVLGNSPQDVLYVDEWYKLFKVKIFSDGHIMWSPGGVFTADCDIDVTLYPFDTQICYFKFENWIYSGDKVNLTVSPNAEDVMLSYFKDTNGQWSILDNKVIRRDLYYPEISLPFPEVYFAVEFQRKTLFYVVNIILVSLFFALLVMMTFFLPPESGERISMGVTILLSFSVFILMVNDEIPKTSNEVPVIIAYLIICIALSTLSIAETVLVLNIYHAKHNKKPPSWLYSLCCNSHKEASKSKAKKYHGKAVISLVNAVSSGFDNTLSTNNIHETAEHQLPNSYVYEYTTKEAVMAQSRQEIEKEANYVPLWNEIAKFIDRFSFCLALILFIASILSVAIILPCFQSQRDISNISEWI